jgi:hypothetical protein
MVEVGDTFLIPTRHSQYKRESLYIVSRIVDSNVLLFRLCFPNINIEKVCIIHEGEHSFIHNESVIDYSLPIYTAVKNIETLVRAGEISPHEPFTKPLLQRVLDGARESVLLPSKYYEILFG